MNKIECPNCGGFKKPWFSLCWECSEKEKQKPRCNVCGVEVKEGYNLCTKHYLEKKQEEENLRRLDYIEDKKKKEFREKYKGKYDFNQIKFKSKSELIIYLFLKQNGWTPLYEERLEIGDKEYHPDFVIENEKEVIIIEHFGLKDLKYIESVKLKKEEYRKLCEENPEFKFVYTTEEDLCNLKDRLGKKLNNTSIKKIHWR